MADLFDRFESYGQASGGRQQQQNVAVNPFEDIDITAIQSRRMQEMRAPEFPIFKRQDADLPGMSSGITHLCVSSGWVTVIMVGNIIYRYNIANPRNIEQHEIKREDDRVKKVFQDPTGAHLLVCMSSKECYYIGQASKRPQPRLLPRVKGQVIESVAWNKLEMKEQGGGTGAILLGTANGSIYETDVLFEDSILKQRKGYFVELYQLYDSSEYSDPITGLYLEPFPSSNSKCFIMVTTPRRIYEFIGSLNRTDTPQFGELFTHYQSIKLPFLEIPGTLKDSQLHVWPSHPDKSPQFFAWLTGAGIYHGKLEFEDQKPGGSLFSEKTLIPYSPDTHVEVTPVGMALTQFHCMLLYRDRVEAICILNQKKVFEDKSYARKDGPLHSICVDPVTSSIYIHQKFRAWTYTSYRETRDVWKIYLEQGQYERAKQYAEGNQEHVDTILIRQAENFFKDGKYQEAAISFSQSQLSFEEVALKFIQVDRTDALKTFLVKKLVSLHREDKAQQTMLTTWLIELFLNELGTLYDRGEQRSYKKLQTEFYTFLSQDSLKECLDINRKTVYDLISSHGAVEDVIFFATHMEDYEKVITHCIQHSNFTEALAVLSVKAAEVLKLPEKEHRARFKPFADLFYKFSPALVKKCAPDTVEAWIKMGKHLEPHKLIPALIQCNQVADSAQVSAAIKYLEFCVNDLRNTQRAIHNYLISSYATSKEKGAYSKLIAYLIKQSNSVPCYDTHYALRLCIEQNLDEACVYIYAAMGLYEESVDLALKMENVELARQVANTQLRSNDTQKRLWLKIAKHVIKKDEDIGKAMDLLQECSLLKIEDVLPFFPDFVTIDHFKDAICTSLTEYNAHIEELKEEMKGATESAKNIRSDIQDIRNKSVTIGADSKCQICETRLLTQGFYMFPCTHAFHRDCLLREVRTLLPERERVELDHLVSRIAAGGGGANGTRATTDIETMTKDNWNGAKVKLDALVGGECLYCGERMINSIQLPFIPYSQRQAALESWK